MVRFIFFPFIIMQTFIQSGFTIPEYQLDIHLFICCTSLGQGGSVLSAISRHV
jgi:hypothetical protein